jgi:predicted phosphodiesterase
VRIALIADIHGNLVALEAVLTAIQRDGVDGIYCLGDVAELGTQPAEAVTKLRELGCPVVLGNTDAHAVARTAETEESSGYEAIATDVDRWTLDQLSEDALAYIDSFAPTLRVDSLGLLGYHGSPHSFIDRIVPTTPDEQIAAWAPESAPVMAGGHTHQQMVRHWSGGLLVNPGSVGLALRRPEVGMVWQQVIDANADAIFTPWAEYAVLEVTETTRSVELRRTRFDLDAAFDAARTNGMPHLDWWMSRWSRD